MRGGWQWSGFFSLIPAGEGEQRLMGGRWHGRVQEWVSLDEGQDIIREISGEGNNAATPTPAQDPGLEDT